MRVKELIEELKNYNPEAILTVGDNFYNGIQISYGCNEGGTKSDALFVCFDEENNENNENERSKTKSKKKLYLSGPMSLCKDKATWKANFQKYEEIFKEKGYDVVNPAKNRIFSTYEKCLKESIQQEMTCDCIFFMENSILSTGARLEYEIAKTCGLEIVLLDENISFSNNYANNSGIKCKNSK